MLGPRTCIFCCQDVGSVTIGRYIHEQRGHNNVHGLTVADFFICPAVGRQDAAQSADALFALEAWVLGQTPVQVLLDLVNCQRLSPSILL
jgi:hypothetical protein